MPINKRNIAKAIILSIITCGIYGFYWAYKQGERLDYSKNLRGIPSGSSNILYLILQIIGLGIVAQALMQDSVNKILDFDSMNNNNGSVNA